MANVLDDIVSTSNSCNKIQQESQWISEFGENLANQVLVEAKQTFTSGLPLWKDSDLNHVFYNQEDRVWNIKNFDGIFWARKIFITATKPIRFYFLDEYVSDSGFADDSFEMDVANNKEEGLHLNNGVIQSTSLSEVNSEETSESGSNSPPFEDDSEAIKEEKVYKKWLKIFAHVELESNESSTTKKGPVVFQNVEEDEEKVKLKESQRKIDNDGEEIVAVNSRKVSRSDLNTRFLDDFEFDNEEELFRHWFKIFAQIEVGNSRSSGRDSIKQTTPFFLAESEENRSSENLTDLGVDDSEQIETCEHVIGNGAADESVQDFEVEKKPTSSSVEVPKMSSEGETTELVSNQNSEEEIYDQWFRIFARIEIERGGSIRKSIVRSKRISILPPKTEDKIEMQELTDFTTEENLKAEKWENMKIVHDDATVTKLRSRTPSIDENEGQEKETTVAVIEVQKVNEDEQVEECSVSAVRNIAVDYEEKQGRRLQLMTADVTDVNEQNQSLSFEEPIKWKLNRKTENSFVEDLRKVDCTNSEILSVRDEVTNNSNESEDQRLQFYIGEGFDSTSGILNLGFEDISDCEDSFDRYASNTDGQRTHRPWCRWSGSISSSLSILALASSLGNLMRLPRMVYFHGGGVFLLVYIIITLLFGIPLTFLEIGLGQFCQHGTVKVWRAVNLFRGVGYAKLLMSFITSVMYMMYIAIAFSLFVWSAKGPLPFPECNYLDENGTVPLFATGEQCLKSTFLTPVSEDPIWFGVNVLFFLLLCTLALACVFKRSRSYKRFVFFTTPVVIIILVALIVEATFRPAEGLKSLLTFHWSKLFNMELWYFAFGQMFFSLQVGFGNISTCAGRLYPKSDAFRSAVFLVVFNLVIGVATVCLVYLWIEQLELKGFTIPHTDVPELFVFSVIYSISTTCIASFPKFWASLSYLLMIIAGLSSVIVFIYTNSVAIAIEGKKKWNWCLVSGGLCFLTFIIGMISMIPEFLAIPHILDHYFVSRSVVALTCLELIGFAYIYGSRNLYNDLEFVIGTRLSFFWKLIWNILPPVLVVIEVCSMCLMPLNGDAPLKDDTWKYSLGWSLYIVTWLIVVICAVYQIYIQVDYNLTQKFLSSIKPSRNWGPVDPIYRHCWVQWRNRYHMTGQKDFSLKRRGTRDYTHSVRTATDSVNSVFDVSGFNTSLSDWMCKRNMMTGQNNTLGQDHTKWRK